MRSFLSSAFFILGLFALSQAQENGGKILDPGFAGKNPRRTGASSSLLRSLEVPISF